MPYRSDEYELLMAFVAALGLDANRVQSLTASGDTQRIDVVMFEENDRSLRTIHSFEFNNYREN